VKCGGDEATDFVEQRRGVRQGCSLIPYLLNTFIDGIMDYISEGNVHALVTGKMSIPGLMFADDLAIGSFTVNGLQKGIDQIVKYCSDWNLKFGLKKDTNTSFYEWGKTENNEKLFMYDKLIDVVNEISYLGVTLESTGEWNRHKMKQMVKGNQSLVAIDKFLTRTPDRRLQLLENVYEMACESRLMYGAKIWGLDEGWKETDIINGRLCKKILGRPRFAANGVAELELGRDSRRGKVLCLAVKYCEELSKIGLGYIWQDVRVNTVGGICKKN
jgi:hypothetical protein